MDAPPELRASPTAWDTPGAVWDASHQYWDAEAEAYYVRLLREMYTVAPLAPLRGGPDYA